jgi:peptidyl-prolyl cis-trans isomerase C
MHTLIIDHAARRNQGAGPPHECRPVAVNTAPSSQQVPMPPVIVNGVTISRRAIAAEVQNFPVRNPGEGWRAATRALVIRELLIQEARRLDVPVEQRTDADGCIETVEDALVQALVEREVRVPQADEETLRCFYGNNRRRFMSAPLWEADHILIRARRDDGEGFAAAHEKALTLAAILSTEPDGFAGLARDCSGCPSAALGGSLGQIGPDDTTPEFEAALTALAEGEISGPVETRYGFHIIRLRRCIEGRQLPFEAVRERVVGYLHEHVRRQATAQYIALLIGRAEIRGIELEGAASSLVQ